MVFYKILSGSKSDQVSRTLLSILDYLTMLMVSIRPSISKPYSSLTKALVTFQSVLITIGISVSFYFLSKIQVTIFLSFFFWF